MYVVRMRRFKLAENNVHVRRTGKDVRRTMSCTATCTTYVYHSVNTALDLSSRSQQL